MDGALKDIGRASYLARSLGLENVDIPLSSILAAKKLVQEVGSVEKARAALEALRLLVHIILITGLYLVCKSNYIKSSNYSK